MLFISDNSRLHVHVGRLPQKSLLQNKHPASEVNYMVCDIFKALTLGTIHTTTFDLYLIVGTYFLV